MGKSDAVLMLQNYAEFYNIQRCI